MRSAVLRGREKSLSPRGNTGGEESARMDYTEQYEVWYRNPASASYWQRRGFSKETVAHFRLGAIPDFCGMKNAPVIPTTPLAYMVRNPKRIPDKDDRRFFPQCLEYCKCFCEDHIRAGEPVFLCESELDAVSLFEVGGLAAAMTATSMANAYYMRSGWTQSMRMFMSFRILEFFPVVRGRKPSLLLLAYDEDEAGDLLTDQTEMLARQAGIPTFDAREILFSHVPRKYLKDEQGEMMPRWNMDGTPRKNAKGELLSKAEKIDCNDALLADRAAFAENVKRVLAEAGMQ